MENNRLTVALVQMPCSPDRAVNRRHIHEQLRAAAAQGARLLVLQELHDSLYFCQSEDSRHFDLMALAGAELLLYPTAIGWDPNDDKPEQQRQLDAWQTVQRAHAVANGIPVLACNRTGFEADASGQTAGIQFWGNSFIAGCQGEVLATAAQDEGELMIAHIDKQRSEEVRRIWPYLRDRRIDAYDDLSLRFRDP